ncbi:Na+/H+ antiporter NhaC family protein [Anaerotardibacter muris]|uniref:Na+/H+ antiporter NhaC family protein n=1 Tax=Anaerotardibacter muris TaxID=2941505 RepID=UPI00203B8200|nr:Na+/H+ antiporter NhaC family protein [Anaerotardibacter muris]
MEGFVLLDTGAWSLVPPLLALALALITKEVYSSLIIGVVSGLLIYQFNLTGVGVEQTIEGLSLLPSIFIEQISANAGLILFLALLGALTTLITKAGGSLAYAKWAVKRIKNPRAASIATAVLGLIIFVDDYFNCLTVGTVMRPVTDRFKICREKLAWIIDSTAAPICIIVPVSSWAVAVGGYLGEDGFNTFVASIPYNLYALLTIVFVFAMCACGRDWGPMKRAQQAFETRFSRPRKGIKHAAEESLAPSTQAVLEDLEETIEDSARLQETAGEAMETYAQLGISKNGKVYDLVGPILVLIVFSVLGMMYAGGFFQGVDFATAMGEDPITGLCIGSLVALVVAALLYLPRKLLDLSGYIAGASEGMRSMVEAIMILVLAWSLGGCCRYMLGTGTFIAGVLDASGFALQFLPAIIFVASAFIGFSMGTSWGTIALVIPIVIGVFPASDPFYLLTIGATLAGAVYGDHISPISDTTILSSAGASCNHLAHVTTQLPYASFVAVVCFVGYLAAAVTVSPWPSLVGGIVAIAILIAVLVIKNRQSA